MFVASLKVNAFSQWASYGVNTLIAFFLTPFVIKMLDITGFGIWSLAIVFVGYYGFFNTAVSSSITRYVAHHAGKGDLESLKKTISSAMLICLISGMVALVISFGFTDNIVGFFDKTPKALVNDFKIVIRILGTATGIGFILSLLSAIVTAHEKFVVVSITGIGINLLRATLTVFWLLKGKGLIGIAWAILISTMVGVVANYMICRRVLPKIKISLSFAHWDVLHTLLLYSATTMVIVLGDLLRTQIDSTVIGKMVGFEKVAIYSIAGSLIGQMVSFTIAGIGVLTPRFANLDGKGFSQNLRNLFLKSLQCSSILGFGLCLMTFIWGGNFIRLWVGESFDQSIPILWILTCAWATDLSQSPGTGMMYALNKHKFYAVVCVLEGVIKLGLTLILVKQYGIMGAAVASAVPMIAMRVLLQPIYIARIVGLPLRKYAQPFIVPLISSAIVIGGGFVIGAYSNRLAGNLLSLSGYVGITALFFLGTNLILTYFLRQPGLLFALGIVKE
jgi:O-antigen/teichoic acid export membrane protein